MTPRKALLVSVIVAIVLVVIVFNAAWEKSRARTVEVTIPEGSTVSGINQKLAESGVFTAGLSLPESEEGYLFPDTYQFYIPSSEQIVEDRMILDFNRKVLPIIPPKSDLNRIITVASLIQAEAKSYSDMKLVSDVIYKRLRAGMPLQIDATICYIKKKMPCLPITRTDLKTDSPYNTYMNRGLPPAPIDNPGLNAIMAAINPEKSPYWYYLSIPGSGKLVFASTLDEQNKNIVKYLK